MRLPSAALTAFVLLFSFACKSRDRVHVETTEEPPRMMATLAMSDPKATAQLVSGIYGIEAGGWRWTAGHFTVLLRPPSGSDTSGAVLKLKLNVPGAVLDRVKTITLSANVGATALAPETYTKPGDYTYSRDIPASLLAGDSVKIEFALSKYLASGSVETRELGIIVTSVGLEHK